MAVALLGRIEAPVRGIEVLVSAMAIGEPLHLDLAEDGHQGSPVAHLDSAVGHCLGVEHRVEPGLVHRTHVEVVLVHPAQ